MWATGSTRVPCCSMCQNGYRQLYWLFWQLVLATGLPDAEARGADLQSDIKSFSLIKALLDGGHTSGISAAQMLMLACLTTARGHIEGIDQFCVCGGHACPECGDPRFANCFAVFGFQNDLNKFTLN